MCVITLPSQGASPFGFCSASPLVPPWVIEDYPCLGTWVPNQTRRCQQPASLDYELSLGLCSLTLEAFVAQISWPPGPSLPLSDSDCVSYFLLTGLFRD